MSKPCATAAARGAWTLLLLAGLLAGPAGAADEAAPAAPATAAAPAKTDKQQAREEAAAKKAAARQAQLEAKAAAAEAKQKAAEERAWQRRINQLTAKYLREAEAEAKAAEAARKKAEKQQAREAAAAKKAAARQARTAAPPATPVVEAGPVQPVPVVEPVVVPTPTAPETATAPATAKTKKQQAREEAAAKKAAAGQAQLAAKAAAAEAKQAKRAAKQAAADAQQAVAPTRGRAKPYVETAPKRGFHLFLRPKKKNPADQWAYVQKLEAANKTRAAAKQALALRIFYPNSPEAPQAQLLHARLLERRNHPQEAFDAYQHLMEHYTGRFEFNEVVNRQMQIAKLLMDYRKGKFLFLPGFAAPERAIPLFEKILASAPEGPHAAEAYYLTGAANERIFEYEKAIDAYFNALNRFPQSAFAEPAAFSQAQCHIKISNEAPNDNRALATAHAACVLFLQRYPDSARRPQVEADLARLRGRQVRNAYALARYYDRILRKPAAALIEYQSFAALYPDAEQAPAVRKRIAELEAARPQPEN